MWLTLYTVHVYRSHSHFVPAPTNTHISTGLLNKEKCFKVDCTPKVKETIWGKVIVKQTIDISLKVFQDILHEPIGQDVIMRRRHFRTKLMSQYIGSSQKKKRFDVRIQELVSKVQNPGPFLRKMFLGSIFGFFSCSVAIFAPIFMKFWLQG